MKKIVVIGGGAAGMMAAGTAAQCGAQVVLVEKNRNLGRKVLITGKGRCNVTNACEEVEELIANVTKNSSFLYSSFYGFSNLDTIKFFENLGVPLKVERGKRVFPESDESKSIVDALKGYLEKNGVKVINDTADEVLTEDKKAVGVVLQKGGTIKADKVVLATGGLSYQQTGSTGDGIWWAEDLGHKIEEPMPSLVPLKTVEIWPKELQGLALKNIGITFFDGKKKVYEDFGEMMFAHFGITGPVVLSASAHLRPMKKEKYKAVIDLKPALDFKTLDARLLRDFEENKNKSLGNCLKNLLPINMIGTFLSLCGIEYTKKVNVITKEERKTILHKLKELEVTIEDFCPIEQAIVTSGGVSVKDINPSTMESKLVSNLYFCGEMIDVDAYTGGFNLQIAFSTGRLAGLSAAE